MNRTFKHYVQPLDSFLKLHSPLSCSSRQVQSVMKDPSTSTQLGQRIKGGVLLNRAQKGGWKWGNQRSENSLPKMFHGETMSCDATLGLKNESLTAALVSCEPGCP
jgi:hypothetical protein